MIDVRKELVAVFGKVKMDTATHSSDQLADNLLLEMHRRGIAVVDALDVVDPPDEHLRTMKKMRKILDDAMSSDDCAPRDLASLSRRLIEVQRDISTMEEQIRQENKRSGRNNGKATTRAGDTKLDPADL